MKHAPTKRSAPRRSRRTLSPQTSLSAEGKERVMKAPLVTSSEKRELILAHAAMRASRDPQYIASVWAGAAVTFAVILVAWWGLAKPTYLGLFSRSPDAEVLAAKQITVEFGARATQDLESASKRLSALESQVTRDQNTLDRMAKFMQESSTSTIFTSTHSSSTHTITTYARPPARKR